MPKVKITEIDNTGAIQLNSVSNVVYIPGASVSAVEPILYLSARELKNAKSEKGYYEDGSYKLAYRLLQLGMQVLYEGVVGTQESGGEYSVDLSGLDYERLADKNMYNIRFLTTGAYAQPSKNMLECAYDRGDCIALVDHENYADYDVATVRTDIEDYLDSTTKEVGSYCSAFSPWLDLRLTDSGSDITTMPGSAGYLLAYARSVQTNPNWYAAAGSFRGVISELVKPVYALSKAEAEVLQARAKGAEVDLDEAGDNVGVAINPICEIRPFGCIVYGNRTLLENKAGSDGVGVTKATSFLNVRNLISTLKKELYFASNKYTFEQNSEVLWINFKSQITPLLDQMQSGNGIEGYKLVKQPTDKKARLKAKVIIVPIEAVEDFELEVSLEDSLEVVEQ